MLRIRIGPTAAGAAASEVARPNVMRRVAGRFQTAFSAVPRARRPELFLRLGGTRCPSIEGGPDTHEDVVARLDDWQAHVLYCRDLGG